MDLAQIIEDRARIVGDLILVDDFLNHRVDPDIIQMVGKDLADRYAAAAPDIVLTAEASGIPPALICGIELGIPIVYAKKYPGDGERPAYSRAVLSPTKGVEYRVEVARRVVAPPGRVLIVDDFLARGRTAEALGEIAEEAGGVVVGYGFAIEKAYMGGRIRLEHHGWRVESVATIVDIVDGSPLVETT